MTFDAAAAGQQTRQAGGVATAFGGKPTKRAY